MKVFVDVYMAKNLGDDLFIDILSKKFPNTNFTLNYYGKGYDDFLSRYNNLKRSNYPVVYKVLNRLGIYDYINDAKRISRQFDVLVFLGGSVFREESYWKDVYAQRMKLVQEFRKQSKPVFILGANFGPYKTEEFYSNYYSLFSQCNDVCFRESYSKELFKDLECVRSSADIIFQTKIPTTTNKRKNIAYSIIDPSHKEGLADYRDEYIKAVVGSIKNVIDLGYTCTLMSFCKNEGDLKTCEEIFKSIPINLKSYVKILDYQGDIEPILKEISESQLIIASRFHANILGVVAQTNILPLIYSDKTLNVLKDIGFKDKILRIEECKEINNKEMIEGLLTVHEQVSDLNDIKKNSLKHFSVLENIL